MLINEERVNNSNIAKSIIVGLCILFSTFDSHATSISRLQIVVNPAQHLSDVDSGNKYLVQKIGGRKMAGSKKLLEAVERLDKALVISILDKGADASGVSGRAPIALAISADDLEIAKILLNAGANPNGKMGGEPALFLAARIGYIDAIELLVDSGADIDAPNGAGEPPSMVAASTNNWQAVLHLLDRGASPYATKDIGVTLAYRATKSRLLLSSKKGGYLKTVRDRLEAAGIEMPAAGPAQVRAMIANGSWPPK